MTTSQTPAVAPPVAAAGTISRRDPSTPTEAAGCSPCPAGVGSPTGDRPGEDLSRPPVGEPTSLITFGYGYTHHLGPRCTACDTTEAHCARDEGCCVDCTHFGPQLLRRMPVRCGTERGYQRHRYVKTPACLPCRAAHNRHNRKRS